MNFKGKVCKKSGITLIALVITIIVLLILAGVAIATLTGENGILTQASRAKEENEKAEIIEQIKLDIADKQIENQGEINQIEIEELVSKKYGEIKNGILNVSGTNYKVPMSDIWNEWNSNLLNGSNFIYGYNLQPYDGSIAVAKNYMVTDYINVETNTKYIVSETQVIQGIETAVRAIVYDENKNFIQVVYDEKRTESKVYTHSFDVPENGVYVRIQFRITDENCTLIKDTITEEVKSKEIGLENGKLIYKNNSYLQGIAVSNNYLFVSVSESKNSDPNDYKIRKVNRSDGSIVLTSTETFNHANGMTYNENKNELIVVALNGNSSTTTTTSDDDYSLYVIDADSLQLIETVNLKTIILEICDVSVGIGGVTYDSDSDEYYIMTRYPKRYIIALNNDFQIISSTYLCDTSAFGGVTGDLTTDGNYFYIPTWRSDINSLYNQINVYSKNGNLVKEYIIKGISHIESIDIINQNFYSSFIDFSDSSNPAKVYEWENLIN